MKPTREEVLKSAIKRLMDWRDGNESENDDFGYCAGNKAFGDDVIEVLAALLQAANSNSDHVAVISAEPESSLTTDQIVDTALSYGHPVEELFVGFFKRELVTYVRRLEKISQENKSGISSPDRRPNEQNAVQTEQPSLSDARIYEFANAICTPTNGGWHFADGKALMLFARAILSAQRQDSDKDAG